MDQIVKTYKKSERELDETSERVIKEMENNPDYPTLPPAFAELKKVQPEFREARLNAKSGDKKVVSMKNDKKAIVLALLQEVADFVTATCNGDRTLLLSSGFDINSERSNGRPVPSIERLDVELREAGEVIIRAKKVTAVKAYIHQYTTEPPGLTTVWVQEGSSESIHTFTGLASEKRHWFRVIAIGVGNQKAVSPIVSKVIQ